jgi:nucleotide-binding universal stress UspA family protein
VLKTILVALDHTELSDEVIQTLMQIHLDPEAQVILSHVMPTSENVAEVAADRPQGVTLESPYRYVEKQLQDYQEQLPCRSVLEIVSGEPAEEIIRLANIYQADLIVLGNRGLRGLNRILQGSVSSQVVEDAPCSVLVVKPQ